MQVVAPKKVCGSYHLIFSTVAPRNNNPQGTTIIKQTNTQTRENTRSKARALLQRNITVFKAKNPCSQHQLNATTGVGFGGDIRSLAGLARQWCCNILLTKKKFCFGNGLFGFAGARRAAQKKFLDRKHANWSADLNFKLLVPPRTHCQPKGVFVPWEKRKMSLTGHRRKI